MGNQWLTNILFDYLKSAYLYDKLRIEKQNNNNNNKPFKRSKTFNKPIDAGCKMCMMVIVKKFPAG